MTDLLKSNQELITGPPDTILVKVPDPVYEFWWDTAYDLMRNSAPVEERQKRIFSLLQKWVEKDYPSYGIVAFEDYNRADAYILSRKVGRTIAWGMYVLLQIGGSMQPISITDKLLNDASI